MHLLPAGTFSGRDGRGPYVSGSRAAMAAIIERSLARAGATEIVIDYDHQSVFAAVPGVGGTAPAAGWIARLEARDDGIWAQVRWTEAASARIRAGEYRYLSPVYTHDAAGHVGVVLNAGLTNTPNLDLAGVVTAGVLFTDTDTEATMKTIAAKLGLGDTAGEADILAAIAAMQADLKALADAGGVAVQSGATAIAAAIKAKAADPSRFVPVDQVVAVQSQLKALQDQIAAQSATSAVEAAMAAGKVAPATKDWAVSYAKQDPAGFKAFVDAAPVIVAPGAKTAAVPPGATGGGDQLSAEEIAVCKQMGLDQATYLKTRKQEAV
ncbi:MAG: phage protease [Hyphomicrobiaceae bacterium]|nr:phage protease [Hyphomicrobiaceae bacterium]